MALMEGQQPMKTYHKNPEALSCLTPEQYRVTQQDGHVGWSSPIVVDR